MSTVFEALSDGFYTAFFEPDPVRRKEKIENWIKESTPIIQAAVEPELRAYLDGILEATWTEKEWKTRVEKFHRTVPGSGRKDSDLPFIDAYKLYLDVKMEHRRQRDEDISIGVLTPEIRAKTGEASEATKAAIARLSGSRSAGNREDFPQSVLSGQCQTGAYYSW